MDLLSPDTKTALNREAEAVLAGAASTIVSVPRWPGSFAFDGPGFASPIDVEVGEVVERDGFVFCDVLPI